ncbi:integrase, catalytic region, zinc finger, CCHC-type containing protein [Tanacetum coccineum]
MQGVQGTTGYGELLNRVGNANLGQARQVKCYNCNGIGHIARNCTQPKRPQNSEYFKDKMLLMQAQENGVALDEEQLLFLVGGQDNAVDEDVDEQPVQDLALNMDNVFQADDCDAFDSDVDEAPTAQTMFMANLSSADPVYDEAGPSYDSDILSEVHDHDHYQDAVCEHHEEHEMHDDVQPNYVVDSHADYTSNSNMILYDQYVKDNAVPVVQSNVSSVTNDAYMMIYNDMCEPHAHSVSKTTRNIVVDNIITAKLETYKEQVELYERLARKFEKELHSVKLQLASPTNHNKSMVEEVTSLKKDFKQKENKYLEEFLDMKALKEKVAIGYKNPLCLTRAKQVRPALYNGYEIVKNNHVPAIVHNTEDTLEIAKITRRKMHDKMKELTVYPPNTPATLVPRVLPTKSQVKINIFALIQLFLDFEKTCNKRITPTRLTEGERGFEQTKACYLTEVIPFFKTLKEHFEGIQKALTKEVKEMKEIFEELEAEVNQHVIDRKHDEIERKNLLIANDNLIAECLFKDVFHVATNSELNVSSFTEMHDAHTSLKARCLELVIELSNLRDKIQKDNHDELIKRFSNLEITRAKHLEQTTALLTENESLKVQIQNKLSCVNKDQIKPKVPAPGKYVIDVEPIPPRNRNNREVHLVYLKHLKESVETLREIVEKAKAERPLDSSLALACRYTKHSQELLEYVIGTCPKALNTRDNKHASTSLPKKQQVTFEEQCAMSKSNTHKPVEQLNCQKTDVPVPPSTGVNSCTDASGSQPRSILKKHRIPPAKSDSLKKVEDHLRTIRSSLKTTNRVDSSISSKRTRLNHLNFGTINDLTRKDLVRGLPRLKFEKDHLCSACQLGKSKKHTHKPKTKNTNLEVLNTLHMDLCRPMQVQTINGKKYILVIVDDYLRFTWVKFLRLKDETLEVVIKFLKQIKVGLNKTVRNIRTDNGTEFVNKDLTDYYERVGIFHQKTVPRTPQQNGVVKRQNHTLVEAARTMLIFYRALMFLWAEAVATACYTQNRSIIHTRHYKTPYELVHDKKPDFTFFRVFGALCYPTNDSEDLGKLQPTADIGIFVSYAPSRKGYRIYNKRTRRIMETIHVQFDELTEQMAPVQLSKGPAPNFLMPGQISSGLVPNPVLAAPYVPPTNKDLEILFQPMFDEYLEPTRVERLVSPAPAVQVPVKSNQRYVLHVLTTIDQEANCLSKSFTIISALQNPSLHQGVALNLLSWKIILLLLLTMNNFINVFAL